MDAAGKQAAASAAQVEAALKKMGMSSDAISRSMARMGFTTGSTVGSAQALAGALGNTTTKVHSMAAAMSTASGAVIHPMAMAMGQASGRVLTFGQAAQQSTSLFSGFQASVGRAGSALSGLLSSTFGRIATVYTVARAYGAVTDATDRLSKSQIALAGTAKTTGVPLKELIAVSQTAQRQFHLSAVVANDLSTEMFRLAGKAGDVGRATPALQAFLEIGASRGMSAKETLYAVHQAILGIDEGTDKLFNKNPSAIYKEFADRIGTTVGKMSDQEKALALLTAAMTDGEKVRGSYADWLKTTAGLSSQVSTNTENMASAFGRLIDPVRRATLEMLKYGAARLAAGFQGAADARKAGGLGMAGFIAGLAGANEHVSDGGPNGNLGVHPGMAALGPIGDTRISSGEIEALADGYRLHMLTRQEEQRRLEAVRQIKAELKETKDLDKRIELHKQLADLTKQSKESVKEEKEEQRRIKELLEDQREIRIERAGGGNRIAGFGGTSNLGDSNLSAAGVPAILQGAGILPGARSAVAAAMAAPRLPTQTLMQRLRQDLVTGLSQLTPLRERFQDLFSSFFATGRLGQAVRAMGQNILAGMGSIFGKMAAKAIAAAPLFQAIGAAMKNPFTAGFALLAFGVALKALGASMGGEASGSGGGSGAGAIRDQVTRITLSAPGAGGLNAPDAKQPLHVTVIGPDDLSAQRQITKLISNAQRRGY